MTSLHNEQAQVAHPISTVQVPWSPNYSTKIPRSAGTHPTCVLVRPPTLNLNFSDRAPRALLSLITGDDMPDCDVQPWNPGKSLDISRLGGMGVVLSTMNAHGAMFCRNTAALHRSNIRDTFPVAHDALQARFKHRKRASSAPSGLTKSA